VGGVSLTEIGAFAAVLDAARSRADQRQRVDLIARARWATDCRTIGARRDDPLRHFAWQFSGDTRFLEDLYSEQIAAAAARDYINTEGSLWIDRVTVSDAELQRARLGGVALVRNAIYPGHVVSWTFDRPRAEEEVAILVPESTTRRVRINAYNLSALPLSARMTTWDIKPGRWRMKDSAASRRCAGARGDVSVFSARRANRWLTCFRASPLIVPTSVFCRRSDRDKRLLPFSLVGR
jgi:hypothetical protein